MAVVGNLIIFLASSLLVYLLLNICRFLHKAWWLPIRIQHKMRSQGINGPSYRFLHGNSKEILEMRRKVPAGRPIDDLSHHIFPRILPHIHSWVNIYGMNFLYWHGPQAQLVVTEAALIKEIMSNKDDVYPKIEVEGYAKKLVGDGLTAATGEKWRKLRKLANHVFHAESLKNMIPAMISNVEIMVERWKEYEEKEIEVFEEFKMLTSEVISKTAFGCSYREGKDIFDMLMKLALIITRNAQNIRLPGISYVVRSADDIESEKLEHGIRDCILEIIKKRELQMTDDDDEVRNLRNDFLGKLLDANNENDEDKRISVEEMVDECKTFYFAGQETTTCLLGWTILLLAIHDDWQEKARKEVLDLFGHTENPDSDCIPRLKVMNMILEECLRLYPPVPAIRRRVGKEVQLGNITLPPQMELYISPLAIHHDPKIWGEDVHMFKPERFAAGVARATKNTAAAFLPFGFGPTTCVGLNFALVETKIALSMILQRFSFTLSPTYVHTPVQLFVIRPELGIQIILHAL